MSRTTRWVGAGLFAAAVAGVVVAACDSTPAVTAPDDDGWDLSDTTGAFPVYFQSSDEGWVCEAEDLDSPGIDGFKVTCVCAIGYERDLQTGECVPQEDGGGDDPDDPESPGEDDDETAGGGSGGEDPPQDSVNVSLTCDDTVVRGNTVTCNLTTDPEDLTLTNIEWSALVLDLTPDPSQSGGREWSGVVVRDTEIKVSFMLGSTPREGSANIEVTNKDRRWVDGNWYHSRGTGDAPADYSEEPDWDVDAAGDTLTAALCPATGSGCPADANPFLYPDFRIGQGYTVALIDDGPNAGLWYVSLVTLAISSQSWVNPGMYPAWPDRELPEGSQTEECRTKMGLDPDSVVEVDFHSFNGDCKEKDMAAFLEGALDHEEQHHDLMTEAAKDASNDPHWIIRNVTAMSESELRSRVTEELNRINVDLWDGANASEPTGNWSGTIWKWRSSMDRYEESGPWSF